MKIYTRTGDDGTTGVVGGGRVSKNDPLMEAIGGVDELNAALGWCRVVVSGDLVAILDAVQCHLFEIGAELATPRDSKFDNSTLSKSDVAMLEASIDALTEELAPLRQFVLPGGCEAAARLHLARAVCRRAERHVLTLKHSRAEVAAYLNRLSDWLFVASRTANVRSNVEDVKWTSTRG